MDWRERLAKWIQEQLPAADSVEVARIGTMPAGASNDTVSVDLGVTCEGQVHELKLVLRPQREAGILAPYDIERQFRVMRALARTGVPVPAVLWHEREREVLGTPFFFMERVTGDTLPLFWYGGRTARLEAAAGALAAVHDVAWEAAGLEFLRGESGMQAIASDLEQWRARARHARIDQSPLLVALGDWLTRNEPADARAALLHGDPNPGNYLMRDNEVVAVLDWELAAIGDPRSDLGFYAALLTAFSVMPAEGGRTLLSEAYEGVTGRRQHNLEYYEAAGLYKMAIALSGWSWQLGRGPGFYGLDSISRRLSVLLGPRWAA